MPDSALILIDIQDGFLLPEWGRRNNPSFAENVTILLNHWRSSEGPIWHIRHCSVHPNSPLAPCHPGNRFMPCAAPAGGEAILEKSVNSAFIGTRLAQDLTTAGIKSLVLAGLTTDHCVSTTARMGANLGWTCTVVSDATATFARVGPSGRGYTADEVHDVSLASLAREFATIATTASIIRLRRDTADRGQMGTGYPDLAN